MEFFCCVEGELFRGSVGGVMVVEEGLHFRNSEALDVVIQQKMSLESTHNHSAGSMGC